VLRGKKGIVTGVANNKSIAYEISKVLSENGASVALSYQSERLKSRVEDLAESIKSDLIIPLDVTDENQVSACFDQIAKKWGKIDFLVHSIAFADKEALLGKYLDTSLASFTNSLNISCYSLTLLSRYATKLMHEGGSIVSLTYHGSQKVFPNYNVMGVAKAALESSIRYLAHDLGSDKIRVNGISAGPIKTLAASGIGGIRSMLDMHSSNAPLQRNVTQREVANSALYLISDLSSAVTGEIHYVDAGYNIMGSLHKNSPTKI
jgi:enoyl-[acyl-carrier protein] reductase I